MVTVAAGTGQGTGQGVCHGGASLSPIPPTMRTVLASLAVALGPAFGQTPSPSHTTARASHPPSTVQPTPSPTRIPTLAPSPMPTSYPTVCIPIDLEQDFYEENEASVARNLNRYIPECRREAYCDLSQALNDRINGYEYARVATAAVALLGCLAVLLVIAGHSRREKQAINVPTRVNFLIGGVFFANAIFSVGQLIPVNLRYTSGPRCGSNVVTAVNSDVLKSCLPEAFSYLGLYLTLMFEMVVIVVSIMALRVAVRSEPISSFNVGLRTEVAAYVVCVLVGVWALLGYYLRCAPLTHALEDSLNPPDHQRMMSYEHDHQALISGMVGVSMFIVTVHMICFLWQRWLIHKVYLLSIAQGVDADERLGAMMKLGYQLSGRAFCVVAAYMIPLSIAASESCTIQSTHAQAYPRSDVTPCHSVCAVVLAFRPIALVLVYFSYYDNRAELYTPGALLGRTKVRALSSWRWCISVQSSQIPDGPKFTPLDDCGDAGPPVEMPPGGGGQGGELKFPTLGDVVDSAIPYAAFEDDIGGGGGGGGGGGIGAPVPLAHGSTVP